LTRPRPTAATQSDDGLIDAVLTVAHANQDHVSIGAPDPVHMLNVGDTRIFISIFPTIALWPRFRSQTEVPTLCNGALFVPDL
jgi:hypothetical protein